MLLLFEVSCSHNMSVTLQAVPTQRLLLISESTCPSQRHLGNFDPRFFLLFCLLVAAGQVTTQNLGVGKSGSVVGIHDEQITPINHWINRVKHKVYLPLIF